MVCTIRVVLLPQKESGQRVCCIRSYPTRYANSFSAGECPTASLAAILKAMIQCAVPSSAEFLTSRYSHELEILNSLTRDGYGAAYIHYTRFRLLGRIATEIGLDISKPSQTATTSGVRLTYPALFEWATVNAGSFGNKKSIMAQTERARQDLASLTNPTPLQRTLLQQLNDLATDPDLGRTRSVPKGWSMSQLLLHLSSFVPALRPAGPRIR